MSGVLLAAGSCAEGDCVPGSPVVQAASANRMMSARIAAKHFFMLGSSLFSLFSTGLHRMVTYLKAL